MNDTQMPDGRGVVRQKDIEIIMNDNGTEDIQRDSKDMVRYKKVKVSFNVTTKRGKKKKITFTARKPVKKR